MSSNICGVPLCDAVYFGTYIPMFQMNQVAVSPKGINQPSQTPARKPQICLIIYLCNDDFSTARLPSLNDSFIE